MGFIIRVLHVDVHVLPGLPEGVRRVGGWVGGVAPAAHLSASSCKRNVAAERDKCQTAEPRNQSKDSN